MAQFLEPPPNVIPEFNYIWRAWLRKLYDNIKETETEADGTFANAFLTGDVKVHIGSATAPSGWILWDDGTIGNAASGASTRANADTFALYEHLWDNYSDSICPVSTGRGASATADFNDGETLTLPLGAGRSMGVAGSGAGLTTRTNGATVGAETHSLSAAESGLRAHLHDDGTLGTSTDGDHFHTGVAGAVSAGTGFQAGLTNQENVGNSTTDGDHDHDVTGNTGTVSALSGSAHNIMQPTGFYPHFIKL